MWQQGMAIRCPELVAGEGQNQPQLRIMLGNCHQVNDNEGQVEVGRYRPVGRSPSSINMKKAKEKGPKIRAFFQA
jgi:hypothetical protein